MSRNTTNETVRNNTVTETISKEEIKMEKSTTMQQVNELIKEIQTNHNELMKGEQKSDKAAREIGRKLLKIERERLFLSCKDKKGNTTATMAKFIKTNFQFSYQYGVMLKSSALVQEILELNDKVSFRLLRSLNRYTGKAEAMKEIWKNAVQRSNGVPGRKQLDQSIKEWEKLHPGDGYRSSRSSLDEILGKKSLTLKEIGSLLTKLDQADISQEAGDILLAKIKDLLQQESKETKAA